MTHHRACLALLVLGCCQLCLMASSSADGTCTNQASHSEQAGALHSVRAMASASSSGEAPSGMELATLGGGCFWCLEACYQQLKGVSKVVSGYAGGHVVNPTYKQVCDKTTGHAEVVQLTYDPAIVAYEDLLKVFYTIHDPTTKDQQGNDVGPQYRSWIGYHTDAQKATAEAVMAKVAAQQWWGAAPLTTELKPLEVFYAAEDHHQNYFVENPRQPYCQFVVAPKVQKFRSKFLAQLMA